MTDLFDESEGGTPLEPEEREGLKQSWITTRADLNIAEQANIDQAHAWLIRRRTKDILNDGFSRQLHKKMFADVWEWAGQYRKTERNIGIDPIRIGVELAQLFDDVNYWIENETYTHDETAIRFHHRLVAIHPFPNGNGRHARMMADLLMENFEEPPFTWGGNRLSDISEMRTQYISALQKADRHDIEPLLKFAKQ